MTEYIKSMRARVGHAPLLQCGASVIIINEKNELLLQRRRDNGCWGYHGGSVELDEEVSEAAARELYEETGLRAESLELFGVFSGPELHYVYPNGDEVSNIDIVYICRRYSGELKREEAEVSELRFFGVDDLPENISPPNVKAIGELLRTLRSEKAAADRDAVSAHYDALIDEDNDPVRDPPVLREYMDKWDGKPFIGALGLTREKTVLEIGVGSGRLALRTAPLCGELWGIDISPKTVARARENLAGHPNVTLLCGDFMTYTFDRLFDVVYSSLTFLHIEDKLTAINKVAGLLAPGGRFVLSIGKDRSEALDFGARRLRVWPDDPDETLGLIRAARLRAAGHVETEFAHIIIAEK